MIENSVHLHTKGKRCAQFQLSVDAANKCAAPEIAELPYAGSGYNYGLEDYFGLVPAPSLDPFGMTFDCVGSNCTAKIEEEGEGFLALSVGLRCCKRSSCGKLTSQVFLLSLHSLATQQ